MDDGTDDGSEDGVYDDTDDGEGVVKTTNTSASSTATRTAASSTMIAVLSFAKLVVSAAAYAEAPAVESAGRAASVAEVNASTSVTSMSPYTVPLNVISIESDRSLRRPVLAAHTLSTVPSSVGSNTNLDISNATAKEILLLN